MSEKSRKSEETTQLGTETTAPPNPQRWWVLAVLCLVVTVVEVDATVVNVALPSMAADLSASSSDLAWISDAYILTFAAFMLIGGRLGDQYGHKRLLQASLTIFGVASLLCVLATSTGQLLAWRALLGVGGAGILPASLALVTISFPKEERPKAFGIWSAMTVLGLPLGPVLGGWLLNHFWWGSVFLINIPLVLVTMVSAQLLIKTPAGAGGRGLDVPGVLLSALGTGTLLFAIIEGPRLGWATPGTIGAAVAGVILLAVFVGWQRRAPAPVLDLGLLRVRTFVVGSMAASLSFFVFTGIMFVLTQYLQGVLRYEPLNAGLGLVPLALLFTLASIIAGPMAAKIGSRGVIAIGLLLIGVGMFILVAADTDTTYSLVGVSLGFTGLGAGLTVGQAIATSLSQVPPALAGVGSAVGNSARQIGGALGVAVLGSVLASVYAGNVTGSLLSAFPADVVGKASESVNSLTEAAALLDRAQADRFLELGREAFVNGMHTSMLVGGVLAVLSAAVVFTSLPKGNLARGEELV
ncbi:MFS transporter [Acrocarpospora pleiomorpha]|uniref:MFS transporter n=1 Tax=Acrocarpospora pleiomorpha TaxID=90975 RepID=A0A5M3XDT2_9ACTN|nr:MFS transporter [Acrocarpospora pleiomorpha]GES18806.1 MFS transporter [Acrocarpospora pleiomorpha]